MHTGWGIGFQRRSDIGRGQAACFGNITGITGKPGNL
jgi:hypothetical protein